MARLPVLFLASLLLCVPAAALAGGSGTLSPSTPILNYTGGPYTGANPSNNVQDEPDCTLVPNTCDDYILTVDVPPNYFTLNPTHIVTIKVSWPNNANDFDLYIQNPGTGLNITSSATSADPEIAVIDPVAGVYRVRTLVFAAVNETFTGTITLGPRPESGVGDGIYVASNDAFSCNLHLVGTGPAFNHDGDGEPAVKISKDGVAWFGAIAGVPAGNGLWQMTDPCGQSFVFKNLTDLSVGGGDIDVEIAPERNLLNNYNIYMSSLWLGNITSVTSSDNGTTFVPVVVSDPVPVNDRQWNAAYGPLTLYLSWRTANSGNELFIVRSDNGGITFGPPVPVYDDVVATALATQLGNLVVDTRPVPMGTAPLTAGPDGQGALYHGYILTVPSAHTIYVAVSKDFGLSWVSKPVHIGQAGETFDHNFSWVAVDSDGNVYTTWSDDHNVFYSFSTDQGDTWSRPIRVSNGAPTKTAIFPMVEAGSAGRIAFGWYGCSASSSQDATAQWHFFHSRCQNALAPVPTFELVKASDRIVHSGVVCQDGLACSCCRQLLELAEIGINPVDGATSITYGAFGAIGTYISRQIRGKSAYADKTVVDRSSICCTPTATVVERFAASEGGGGVELMWSARGTGDVVAWNVSRALESDGSAAVFERINATPIAMGDGGEFRFHDAAAPAGTLLYRLSGVAADGAELIVETARLTRGLVAHQIGLRLAGPNPFRGGTEITYSLPLRSEVRLEVFGVGGQRVRTLVNRTDEAGSYTVPFRLWQPGARLLGPGVYLVKLTAGTFESNLRMVALE
jgi:hypothetical protein